MKTNLKTITVFAAVSLLAASAGSAWAWECNDAYGRSHARYRSHFYGTNCRPRYYTQVVMLPAHGETVVINIQNDNGSYTPVTLRYVDGWYVGPRGERYLSRPTEDQLKAIYGLK